MQKVHKVIDTDYYNSFSGLTPEGLRCNYKFETFVLDDAFHSYDLLLRNGKTISNAGVCVLPFSHMVKKVFVTAD